MFRTVWSKTLREYRFAIPGWGIGLGLLLYAEFASATTLDPTSVSTVGQLAKMIRLFGDPLAFTSPAGYVTFRDFGIFLPILLSIWTLLAGARLVRGEEERGSLEVLLSTPHSRLRVLLEKIVALFTALVLIAFLIFVGGVAGEVSAHTAVNVTGMLLAVLNLGVLALLFSMLALFLSQVLGSRAAAAGWTGLFLALSYVLDGTGHIIEHAEWFQWLQRLSPFLYYHASKPLLPFYTLTHGFNPGACLLLLALSIAFAFASLPLFARRDIGGLVLPSWNRYKPEARTDAGLGALEPAWRNVFVRTVGLRTLRAQMFDIGWWVVGLMIGVGWITMLTRSMEAPLHNIYANNPVFYKLFGGYDIGTNAGFLAGAIFAFVPVITVIFALLQSLTWASDLEQGRMELVLSTPAPRHRIVLEHFGAVLIAAVVVLLAIWLSILVGASLTDLHVDAGNVAAASFSILPLELITASLVYTLAGRLHPGAILGMVGTFLALSFFVELVQSLLKLPEWAKSLSIFHHYGSPITDGWQWGPFAAMLGIAALLLALGVVQFTHAGIERGT
jgi:ABC-2 type transport system permease protein